MESYKLKIKIGEHEFEAEGPVDIVQDQFAAFRELVLKIPNRTEAAPEPTPQRPNDGENRSEVVLDKIMRKDGRVVSLTARAASLEDEILLVLLGQKVLRDNEAVTGAEIMDGLKRTGHAVSRIDYRMDKMSEGTAATVITIGTGRARRYRLTNQGFNRAQELAAALVQRVA